MSTPPKPWESNNTPINNTTTATDNPTTTLDAIGSGYNTGINSMGNYGYGSNSYGGGYGGYSSMMNNSFGGGYGYNSMMNPQMQMNNPVIAKLQTFQAIISTFYSTAHVLESSYQFIMNIVYIFIGMHEQIDGAKTKAWAFYDSAKAFLFKFKNTSVKEILQSAYNNKPTLITKDEFTNYLKNKEKHWNTLKLILSIIGTIYFIKRIANYLVHVPIAKITNVSPEMQKLGLKIGDGIGILAFKLLDVDNSKPHSLARWQGKSIKIPADSYEISE